MAVSLPLALLFGAITLAWIIGWYNEFAGGKAIDIGQGVVIEAKAERPSRRRTSYMHRAIIEYRDPDKSQKRTLSLSVFAGTFTVGEKVPLGIVQGRVVAMSNWVRSQEYVFLITLFGVLGGLCAWLAYDAIPAPPTRLT